MSLDEQIQKLQRKKSTIQKIDEVMEYVEQLEDPEGFEGVAEEVKDGFREFSEKWKEHIEKGGEGKKQAKQQQQQKEPDQENQQKPSADGVYEFAMKFAPFQGRTILAETEQGDHIEGVLKQIDYPYLLVASSSDGELYSVKSETVTEKKE